MKPLRFLVLVSMLAAVGLAGGVGARPKKAPPPAPEGPPVIDAPPMPPMPAVGLGERFLRDAAAYEDYMRQAAQIAPNFADPAAVSQALKTGVAFQPAQFQRGELAHAAIAALQDRAFVAAVRAVGVSPQTRYQILAHIFTDPSYGLTFRDGSTAAGLAKQSLSADGMRLLTAGKSVRQYAYDMQHQPWSKTDVLDRDARLAGAKMLSTVPRQVADDDVSRLRATAAGALPDPSLEPAPPPYSPLVIRATALAALAAIGQAGDDMADRLSWLSQDYFTEHCLSHAKNELNECLAVAKPNYEDVFCLGEPTMMYAGECVVKGAGGTVPLEILTRRIAIPTVHHRPTRRRR